VVEVKVVQREAFMHAEIGPEIRLEVVLEAEQRLFGLMRRTRGTNPVTWVKMRAPVAEEP
jgi:hypothetical protein